MIQKGRPSNRQQKHHTRNVDIAVLAPPPVTKFLRGSEITTAFDQEDHPPAIYRPGHAALVLEGQIGGYTMKKIFMDGGSGVNIIFTDTIRRMNRSVENLPQSTNTFHGIVPGKAVRPEGTIQLDVTFGDAAHFRRELINFDVVDWKSQYHAISGRPAFARFMAVPH